MIKKLILEFIILAGLIFATWFILARIDWITLLRVEKKTRITEEKIGELLWRTMKASESEIIAGPVIVPIDSILSRICISNNIDGSGLRLHLLRKDEINAFALPGNHIIVYSGLLDACRNEAEFCGVLCHEIAHIEKGHIMNKLAKEVGLSMLISISSGGGNSEIAREALKHLTSTAYDRNLESEADRIAVEYLIHANIDPWPFSDFLYRLSQNDNLPAQFQWISTHPDSGERSFVIAGLIKDKSFLKKPVLREFGWNLLKEKVREIE